MSSSSVASPESRSPSPHTPGASEVSEAISIQDEIDQATAFFVQMHPKGVGFQWGNDMGMYSTPHKVEDDQMLKLDELIEQHAYEDSPSFHSATNFSSPPSYPNTLDSPITLNSREPASPNSTLTTSHRPPIPLTKPIPPPASLPRKTDHAHSNQRTVYPPRESCFNLPIMFPSIPEGGTKSRVETQVRITVDLADSSSSSDPYKYNKVGSWKWLQLPHGTATKKRTRKQGKIDPDPQDLLHLNATVTCATPPHNRVLSCSSCQTREAKRVAKKLAARVRPTRSDSESDADGTGRSKTKNHEDTTSIIQFNCAEHLDFSTGSVVLPVRITCYCRHHREKVGFNVHFTLMDHTGRLVGSGMTRPIMITDDHKTTSTTKAPELTPSYGALDPRDWGQVGAMFTEIPAAGGSHVRRKGDINGTITRRRQKPYDSASKPSRVSREGSLSSATSPSSTHSPLPTTRASTPSLLHTLSAAELLPPRTQPHLSYGMQGSETSSPDMLATPLDNNSDVPMPQASFDLQEPQPEQQIPPLQASSTILPPDMAALTSLPHPMPYLYFDPNHSQVQMQLPVIHRLIPNMGPTFGGIEVTILGANFHTTVQLNCMFGDVAATATQRWSDNTLVCILPPRATPGVVPVWFDGFPKTEDGPLSPLFTYSDESDRALMELALQVVGLKMTGKIEDAKNVAMRIVGNTGSDGTDASSGSAPGMMQMASSAVRDVRPLLLARAGETDNFEAHIMQFLSVIDTPLDDDDAPRSLPSATALSHTSSSGQTLLHLASLLGFASLTDFLIERGADLDVRDRNGFTPLHFAALSSSSACASALVKAGADIEIVNSLGKTAQEIVPPGFFDKIIPKQETSDDDNSEDDEADLGDVEDEESEVRQIIKRRLNRKSSRLHSNKSTLQRSANVSCAVTPPPSDEKVKKLELEKDKEAEAKEEQDAADAKRAASFMEKMIQRTLAQIPARPDIMHNIPQLPLPHLPDFPAVPWGALPQIPMVFPVFVPMMPNWPSFRGGNPGEKAEGEPQGEQDEATKGGVALRAAQEWRGLWEKWVAMAARQQTEDVPPPEYTPRAEEPFQAAIQDKQDQQPIVSTSRRQHNEARPIVYDDKPLPEEVVESFGYQPNLKQRRRLQKKDDKMLIIFWLPIFLLSIIWAFLHGFQFVVDVVRTALPGKAVISS